jgi:hypothetical protein
LGALLVMIPLALPSFGQPALSAQQTITVTEPGTTQPRLVSKAWLYYDSQQRFRQDVTNFSATGAPTARTVEIIDPVAKRIFRIDPAMRTAEESYFQAPIAADLVPGERGSPFPAGSFVVRPAGELGDQVIEGRECYGTVYGQSPAFQWRITWWDKETGLPVLEIQAGQGGRVVKTTITDIQLGEPDPVLFTVPPEYSLKRMTR